jgi:hypothetical protein
LASTCSYQCTALSALHRMGASNQYVMWYKCNGRVCQMHTSLAQHPSLSALFLKAGAQPIPVVRCCLQELCDLLAGLLNTDSSARLSIPEVQATSWFDGFDWQALQDKTLPPPVLPSHALACAQQA